MTIQDLKNNRNKIIERINEIGNIQFMKEIMQCMANLVNGKMNDSDNVIDLVDEIIEMNSNWEKQHVNTLWGHGCKYSTQAEYQRSCLGSKWN